MNKILIWGIVIVAVAGAAYIILTAYKAPQSYTQTPVSGQPPVSPQPQDTMPSSMTPQTQDITQPSTPSQTQDTNNQPASQSQNTPAAQKQIPAPSNILVAIKNFVFNPATVAVKVGDTVTWINDDSAPHQIKSNTFNSATLSNGQKFSFTFQTAGTYDYSCAIHPSMKGQIIVQ